MKTEVYKSKLLKLLKQQSFVLPALMVLSISQFVSIVFIFCKKERVILVPPLVSQPMWVDGYAVSQTYLEQMGLFLGQMLLSNSAESIKAQMETVLRYVHPSAYTTMRQHLIGEEEHLKKQQGSYHFNVHATEVNMRNHSITLIGDRASYIADRRVDQAKESYVLTFQLNNGRFLLVSCAKGGKA